VARAQLTHLRESGVAVDEIYWEEADLHSSSGPPTGLAMTEKEQREEEQRYARAWEDLRRNRTLSRAIVVLVFSLVALVVAAKLLGLKSLEAAGLGLLAMAIVGAVVLLLALAAAFRCPRCGAHGAFTFHTEDERPASKCYRCNLDIYAPRNPNRIKW
jgi:predicted RNA-binding Zn-ribbon protein involved in translation (DUF1610 family)